MGTSWNGDGHRRPLNDLEDVVPQPLGAGVRKRMRHNARRSLQMSRASREIVSEKVSSARWPRRPFKFDLVEIFGGSSMVSIRAVNSWKLKVLQPIDIRFGVDLRQRKARRWLLRQLDKWNPRLAAVEFPCTFWSILQRNCNFVKDPEGLQQLQALDKPFLKLTEDIFESQRRRGGHAMAENPATSDAFNEPELVNLRKKYYETTSCMCMFGMVGKGGRPLLKRVRWLATHPILAIAMDKQCSRDHEHEKVEGQNTALSAQYPPAVGDAICKAYLDVVAEEDFGQVYDWHPGHLRGVHFVDVVKEADQWRPLLGQAEEILARKTSHDVFPDPSTDLYKKIMQLVPWQIMNVQLASSSSKTCSTRS